jgi:hypothetical protein
MCVYYRALNDITIKNKYLLHRIDDLFNQLCGVCALYDQISIRIRLAEDTRM